MAGPTPTELAFLALADTLNKTAARQARNLKAFTIGVLDRAETWSFDPRRESFFDRGPVFEPALRLFMSESALCKLAFGGDIDAETFQYTGDLDVLKRLGSILVEAKNPLTIRLKETS